MKTTEEKIWNFLDGTASSVEREEIANLVVQDPATNALLEKLAAVHKLMQATELDAPSMSFTRNVLEAIAMEPAPVKLSTRVDKRIIYAVGAFFGLAILAVFIAALLTAGDKTVETGVDLTAIKFDVDISKYLTSTTRNIFLLINLCIALVYFDAVLRRKLMAKKGEGEKE